MTWPIRSDCAFRSWSLCAHRGAACSPGLTSIPRRRYAAYRVTPFGAKEVAVQELGGRPVGKFPVDGTISVPGARFRLAPSALTKGEAIVQVASLEAAAGGVRARLQVTQPNMNANIVLVSYEGNDPYLVRDIPNVVATRFVRKRLETEKAVHAALWCCCASSSTHSVARCTLARRR